LKSKEKRKSTAGGTDSFKNFEQIGLPVVVINSGLDILFVNSTACKLFSYTSKFLLGKNINLVLPGFNSNSLRSFKQEDRLEFNGRNKGNKTLFLELTLGILKDGRSNHYIITANDISDRKKLIGQGRGTGEDKYSVLTGGAPAAVSILDASADKFIFVNDLFVQLTGYELKEINSLSRKDFYELVHYEDRDSLYSEFKNWEDNGFKGTLNHEYRIINKRDEILWINAYFYPGFDANGKLTAVYQIFVDVTKKKENIKHLQLLGNAIESTAEMICITDLSNRFIYINKAFKEKYGYSESELLGREVEVIGSLKNLPEIHQIVLNDTKKGSWEGELINTNKNGIEFPILLSTSQIKDKAGSVIGYIGIARDITELKNKYDTLKHSLKDKETLLKEVYHRVKNNMQVISSLLNMESQSVKEPAASELLKETQNRVRIMQLIHEKLYKSQDLSKIDFSHYIRDLSDQLRRAYPVSKKVTLKIKSVGIYLGVDKAIPCGLIINELVSNAYKYAFKDSQKGEINIELTSRKPGKYLLIVKDNGAGIPADINIHETESLGMMLVTTLTEQLEGTLKLDRSHGTKFIIRF
jgi:PAS domain S-box-containing protein